MMASDSGWVDVVIQGFMIEVPQPRGVEIDSRSSRCNPSN